MSPHKVLRCYDDVRDQVWDADMLLYRRRRSGLIGPGSRSDYTHAAMAGWWGETLMNVETREFHGGRIVTLSSQVLRNEPGTIEVYRCLDLDDAQRENVLKEARRRAGEPYGWHALLHQVAWRVPVVHLFMKPEEDDSASLGGDPFCSALYASAFRLGSGIDPVPNLADKETEPADLARSAAFTYMFSLAPR